ADRMMQSRCFKESGGKTPKMECLTCHNPHVTIFRADRAVDHFNSKCMACHTSASCTAPAAMRHATKPPDDCVSCHMRKGVSDDQLHVRYTDHWIRARIDQPRVERTRFDVEPFFPEMVSKMPVSDQAFFAARAISLRTHVVNADAKKSMWPQAEAKFREALSAGYAKADGPYFLALALSEQGKHAEAAEHYAAAYEKDPNDFDIAFAYGQSLMRQRRTEEAEKVFAIAAKDNPKAAGPIAEQARARAERRDYEGALALFRQAIALEPWTPSIRVNAAKMLSALERHDEAIAEAQEALRRDPEGPKTWNAYALLLSRAGRTADAEIAARRAKELAKAPGLRGSDVRAAM
ncbi:MAG TPA: tetratricopeptide repeat protein, partial [Candidatus Bathyarchaeia archaeon]|nr:tetratricopeptide repeat protein [Candidatus Bathyarchaeia archaeon]